LTATARHTGLHIEGGAAQGRPGHRRKGQGAAPVEWVAVIPMLPASTRRVQPATWTWYVVRDVVKRTTLDIRDSSLRRTLYHLAVVQYLCEQGADKEPMGNVGRTPASLVALLGYKAYLSRSPQAERRLPTAEEARSLDKHQLGPWTRLHFLSVTQHCTNSSPHHTV